MSPTHSDDYADALFASDREFTVWRYGVGHSQLLLRSVPSAGRRCLDIVFERVTWISLPTAMNAIEIALADRGDPDLPAGVSEGIDERSPLLLKVSSQGTTGVVVCAGAEAAYSAWSPAVADSESGDVEVVWSLRKN